jgi:hypothetical protein
VRTPLGSDQEQARAGALLVVLELAAALAGMTESPLALHGGTGGPRALIMQVARNFVRRSVYKCTQCHKRTVPCRMNYIVQKVVPRRVPGPPCVRQVCVVWQV